MHWVDVVYTDAFTMHWVDVVYTDDFRSNSHVDYTAVMATCNHVIDSPHDAHNATAYIMRNKTGKNKMILHFQDHVEWQELDIHWCTVMAVIN